MKRILIAHRTEYRFPQPVRLGPHRLLLRPREGHEVRIVSARLDIAPAPRLRWCRDINDNALVVASFAVPAGTLSIASELVIEHFDDAPLDFVVEEYAVRHPFAYAEAERTDLELWCAPSYPADRAAVAAWVAGLGIGAGPLETYVLLERINRAICTQMAYRMREEPGVQSPATTIALASGSCRDYAALFIEACRSLGLASRFVSGYLHTSETAAGHASTHAWAEVYLPGPGWKGFDPTGGVLTGSDHIPVAVARHPEAIPPVSGSFYGPPDLRADMQVDVRVAAL